MISISRLVFVSVELLSTTFSRVLPFLFPLSVYLQPVTQLASLLVDQCVSSDGSLLWCHSLFHLCLVLVLDKIKSSWVGGIEQGP